MAADLFHRGHLEFIKKAKQYGDFLIIGLHPDDVIKKYKRKAIIPYKDRKAVLASLPWVDKVVADCMDFRRPTMFENLKKYYVDVMIHAGEWIPPCYQKASDMGLGGRFIQLKYYPHTSTTQIIQKIQSRKKI